MAGRDMDLELLLVHADDHQPALQGGLSLEALAGAKQEIPVAERLWQHGGEPNSLPAQRWGLVAPEGKEGDRLLGLVAPLQRTRQQAQGGAPVRVFRVPPRMTGPESMAWRRSFFRAPGVPERELPRYLLMLGDLDQVSLELQQAMAIDAFVGRLCLPADDGYAAYVDKVLRWEANPSPEQRARAVFFSVRDGSPAMGLGYHRLARPMIETFRDGKSQGLLAVGDIVGLEGAGATAERLLAEVAARTPGVLFTMSHGLGAPRAGWRSAEEQRALQGALSLGVASRLAAQDVAGRAFMPGGIWFCFACFGAGTPRRSTYEPWLRRLTPTAGGIDRVLASLPRPGERPFVAALPQAVLAHPDGPLAVIGHIDLAWTYGYQELSGRNHPARFSGVLETLLQGGRAGVAAEALTRFSVEASMELSAIEEEEAMASPENRSPVVPPLLRAQLWMTRQDLAGYVLLGDPAVRLPLAAAGSQSMGAQNIEDLAAGLLGVPVSKP